MTWTQYILPGLLGLCCAGIVVCSLMATVSLCRADRALTKAERKANK